MKFKTLFFVIAVISSCTNYKSREEIYSIQGSNQFYKIITKNNINPSSNCIRYFQNNNNKEWLFYENRDLNEIIIYKFPEGEIEKRIKFEKKGPNGIGSLRGMHIHNLDSIFLVSATHIHNFFLTDTAGTIRKKYKVKPVEGKEISPCINPMSSGLFYNEAIVRNNIINFSTYYPFLNKDNINKKLQKEFIDFSFNLSSNKIINTSFYPKFNTETNNFLFIFDRTLNQDEHIYSFRYLDSIFIKKPNNKERVYTVKNCKSKYRKKAMDMGDITSPIIQQMAHDVEHPHYLSIIYDKYRNCTYRFFYPGVELREDEDPRKMFRNRKKFSIMILNEDLNVVGETMMPEKTYNPNMSFIAEDGLYLALHCDHPKYNPDSLMFERIDLNPINKN